MKCFVVGGAVRDSLLGRASADRDWVVVGASPQQMVDAGFIAVGRDFPVFLHPQTKEEYALARTERKTAPGYRGFVFHADPAVTLDEDLARRDLTINAMAFDAEGALIDPYGGKRDIDAKVLRHVSSAFAEDPVRILRLARFAARYADFTVAPETMALARQMVEAREVDALVPERVWQELARGLMEIRPSRMLSLLRECGALARLMPQVERLWDSMHCSGTNAAISAGEHLLRVLDMSARLGAALRVRFACLGCDLAPTGTPLALPPHPEVHAERRVKLLRDLCRQLRVPIACREFAEVVAREYPSVHRSGSFGAVGLVELLERCDAMRRPGRFEDVLLACECDDRGWPATVEAAYPQRQRLRVALKRALSVDTARVAQEAAGRGMAGPAVGLAIHEARIRAIGSGLGTLNGVLPA